ncbi:SH3 domain-containing protein [Streptomyces toxytricini]|uniref:SH3 domain-containing protein n=1 Tax=Streptomyces toxytricini TaxID=67369 RepID=A0ABW8EJ41_STRT5
MVRRAVAVSAVVAGVVAGTGGWTAGAVGSGGQGPAPERTAAVRAAYPKGVVVSRTGVHVRAKPTVYSNVVKTLRHEQAVYLVCQQRGGWVEGNPVWYRLHGVNGWVSARYVHDLQPVRAC